MASAARPSAEFRLLGQLSISSLWLAFYAQWMTIPVTVMPDQVATLLGPGRHGAEAIVGDISAAGSAIALVVTPLAGALSDRSRSRFGRRRPFLAAGVLISCAALVGLWAAAGGASLWLYALAYLNLQVWWNWAAGPYAGFVPDVVPAGRQAMASGWINVFTVLGTILGAAMMALLYRPSASWGLVPAFIVLNLVCLALTLSVREPPAAAFPRAQGLPAFLRSFLISPRDHPQFYWVLGARLIINMGIWSVLQFLLFYIENVLHVPAAQATTLAPTLLGVGALLAIPASLIGVKLADRIGLVQVVQIASWVMAAASAAYVAIGLHPSIPLMAAAVAVYAIGNGAYGAADWMLALRVLPLGQDAGKDFGVWHVCMVAPQIVAPLTIGYLIDAIQGLVSAPVAYEIAFAIGAAWFVLGSALVSRVRLAA